jgi:putative transposase
MRRRGNCHDNAVAESFFANLKKEKIRRVKFRSREDARQAIFNYIELFYNPRRRHTHKNRVAPAVVERQFFANQKSV